MRKICLTVIGLFLLFVHAFSQTADSVPPGYKPRKLNLEEVNFVTGYYSQTADRSAVMGGRTDSKGISDETDLSNGIDLKFTSWDPKMRKNTLTAGLGTEYHTPASKSYVDSN